MNPFRDHAQFMLCCKQTVGKKNDNQFLLYKNLIEEEYQEFLSAVDAGNEVEILDGLIDTIVTIIGALHSKGYDIEGAWKEIHGSNMSKVDPITGIVLKDAKGKVIKGPGFRKPDLQSFLTVNE